MQPLAKVIKSIEDSIEYMKELFTNSKHNVTQGKKVQRKIRYEKLKTEFHQLILSLSASLTSNPVSRPDSLAHSHLSQADPSSS